MSEEAWFDWYPVEFFSDLREASSCDDVLDKEKFLAGIKVLDLSNRKLAVVPDIVKEMVNLETLNLSNNFIKGEITGELFPSGLKHLDLSRNRISSFSFEGFTPNGLNSLTTLRLDKNYLEELPKKVYLAIGLTNLNLSENRIESLGKEIKIPPNLVTLDVSNNKIEYVEPAPRAGITRLIALNLSNNKLTTLPSGLFRGKLKFVSVAGNDINDWTFLSSALKKGIEVVS